MPPRFLIDENLSPQLALHLASVHGFDAVHVKDLGLLGASDAAVLAHAVAENRVVVTSNANDFRKLGAKTPAHPGLAIIRDAVGVARQLELGVCLATAIDSAGGLSGRLFEIDKTGIVHTYRLP